MVEIFALGIYSVQWLGVVLGVGAEVVLLCAHLIALHQHKPQWLDSVSAVRAAQFTGLFLIIVSGIGAIAYQFLIGQPGLLLQAVFGFKWALIVALVVVYVLEKRVAHGRAVLEGFAGATWLALFLVHSLAPIAGWLDLIVYYVAWLVVFSLGWGAFVLIMKRTGKVAAAALVLDIEPAPVAAKVVPKPAPVVAPIAAPVVAAAPASVIKPVLHVVPPPPPPKPVVKPVVHVAPTVIKVTAPIPPPSQPVAPKPMAAPVVAAVKPAKPAGLPVVERLEIEAPHAVVVPKPAQTEHYKPDYNNIPGLRVMPQRMEDLHLQNRAPIVQPA